MWQSALELGCLLVSVVCGMLQLRREQLTPELMLLLLLLLLLLQLLRPLLVLLRSQALCGGILVKSGDFTQRLVVSWSLGLVGLLSSSLYLRESPLNSCAVIKSGFDAVVSTLTVA